MPLCRPSGPTPCKIAIVGEAPGEQEELTGIPFIGTSGQALFEILGEHGITRDKCFITNVLQTRPPGNDIEKFCGAKKEVGKDYSLPPLRAGKYLKLEHLPALERLRSEIQQCSPNAVLALGRTASWALLGDPRISSVRGAVASSRLCPGVKVLPTFHPAAFLRAWQLRPIVVQDVMKFLREVEFPEIRRPQRFVWIQPTIEDLWQFHDLYLRDASQITFDVETDNHQVKCISFASTPTHALTVPFTNNGDSYWSTLEEEIAAWRFVEHVLTSPVPKLAQNGLYDIQRLWTPHRIRVVNYSDDSMLLHHALQPESEKGLGFLGSIYTDEASWKLMRPRGKDLKRDE